VWRLLQDDRRLNEIVSRAAVILSAAAARQPVSR